MLSEISSYIYLPIKKVFHRSGFGWVYIFPQDAAAPGLGWDGVRAGPGAASLWDQAGPASALWSQPGRQPDPGSGLLGREHRTDVLLRYTN